MDKSDLMIIIMNRTQFEKLISLLHKERIRGNSFISLPFEITRTKSGATINALGKYNLSLLLKKCK